MIDMMKWEYDHIPVDHDEQPLAARLNKVGEKGWEACFTFPGRRYELVLLKRPKPETNGER